MSAWLRFACVFVLASCAEGGFAPDASAPEDAARPPRDSGSASDSGPRPCPSGQHRCGGGCIDDQANDPANGCRLGCGEACPTPPDGTPACDADGTCSYECEPPFHAVGGECVCTPRSCEELDYQCGAPDDGCGMAIDCGDCDGGGTCTVGRCECPSDAREPNESALGAGGDVAFIGDVDDWSMSFDAWTLHAGDDQDWYRFEVEDTGLDNPTITVGLSGIPADSTYSVAIYYVCNGGEDASTCTIASPCTASGSTGTLETSLDVECDRGTFGGSDDSGWLYVRVFSSRFGACGGYTLAVHSAS
jgi:hypothetical protein